VLEYRTSMWLPGVRLVGQNKSRFVFPLRRRTNPLPRNIRASENNFYKKRLHNPSMIMIMIIIIIIIRSGQSLNCIHPTEDIDSDRFLNRCDQSRLFLSCERGPIATELSSAENASGITSKRFDEIASGNISSSWKDLHGASLRTNEPRQVQSRMSFGPICCLLR